MLTNFWEELTTNEIKKINRKTVLIFPFSSIEQHGPHLPLNTDKKILEGILSVSYTHLTLPANACV